MESALPPAARATARDAIAQKASDLSALSKFISDHPELCYKEYKAHDALCTFLEREGFEVQRSHLLETSFRATYKHGRGGRVFGVNSEYDALPDIGHACGHNLIAISGVAALLGVRAAMKESNIEGTVVLLGTPAEEGGVGKQKLLDLGAYDDMDACMMVHPGHYERGVNGVKPGLSVQALRAEFLGKAAHASLAPWDGVNALDAANIAYMSISSLRQQLKPTDRVHGVFTDGGSMPNIIPERAALRYYVRSTTVKELERVKSKVKACFRAATEASGCKVNIEEEVMMMDLRQCRALGDEYARSMTEMFGTQMRVTYDHGVEAPASTDFGNVTYKLPACHPHVGIPTHPGRNIHTPEFEQSARSPEAHEAILEAATGVAVVGLRVLADQEFADLARSHWEKEMESG